jgi:streptogramin lyase
MRIGPVKATLVTGVVIAALAGSSPAMASHSTVARHRSYVIAGEKVFPEGIAVDRRFVYATSKADGIVYRGRVGGSTLRPFLPGGGEGRTTATGIKSTGQRLLIAGAETGRFYIYDAASAAHVATYTVPDPDQPSFLNDVVVAANGDAYITDSMRPVIYRIPAVEVSAQSAGVTRTLQPAIALAGYTKGFNANGIVASPDGKVLLVVYSNSGALYRVDLATGTTRRVELDRPLTNGDGLQLLGHTLYAARNFDNLIVSIRLSGDYTSGTVTAERTYPGADVPTTLALSRGRLLAVNSQFDTFFNGTPQTSPTFTISALPLH